MKKNYKEPSILVLDMEGEDIIATSDGNSGNTATMIVDDSQSSYHKKTNAKVLNFGGDDDSEGDDW